MLSRDSSKRNHRLPSGLVFHFDVAPADSFSPARPERLHRRFLRCEPSCVSLELLLVSLAIIDFGGSVNTLEERLPVPPHCRLDAVNLCDVHSQANNQRILPGNSLFGFKLHYTFIMNRDCGSQDDSMSPAKSRAKTEVTRKRKPLAPRTPMWRMTRVRNLQIIKAKPLEKFDWLVHGFSTRPGGSSVLDRPRSRERRHERVLNLGVTDWDTRENVEANRRDFIQAVGAKEFSIVTLRQIHSDLVHEIAPSLTEPPSGDALVSRMRGLLLAIQTADCIPILLVDPQHHVVAAVHAGWRGTLARIAAKTVGRMQMEFGANPENLLAALGPGIHQCCYEVGPGVVKEFAAQFPRACDWFGGPFDVMSSGEDPNPLPWLTMMPPGHEPPPPRCNLDLYAANSAILVAAGLEPKNIFCSDLCTACRTDLLFSYRREGRTGRMMAVIGVA